MNERAGESRHVRFERRPGGPQASGAREAHQGRPYLSHAPGPPTPGPDHHRPPATAGMAIATFIPEEFTPPSGDEHA
jgi:hypothetical protein